MVDEPTRSPTRRSTTVGHYPPVSPMPLAPRPSWAPAPTRATARPEEWAPPPEGRPIIRPPVTASTSAGAQTASATAAAPR